MKRGRGDAEGGRGERGTMERRRERRDGNYEGKEERCRGRERVEKGVMKKGRDKE
jgi:hypothetical protein